MILVSLGYCNSNTKEQDINTCNDKFSVELLVRFQNMHFKDVCISASVIQKKAWDRHCSKKGTSNIFRQTTQGASNSRRVQTLLQQDQWLEF